MSFGRAAFSKRISSFTCEPYPVSPESGVEVARICRMHVSMYGMVLMELLTTSTVGMSTRAVITEFCSKSWPIRCYVCSDMRCLAHNARQHFLNGSSEAKGFIVRHYCTS